MRISSLGIPVLVISAAASTLYTQPPLTSGSGGGERQPIIAGNGSRILYSVIIGSSRDLFTIDPDGLAGPVQRTFGQSVIATFGTFDNWPSFSIADNGAEFVYWNSAGVWYGGSVTGPPMPVSTASINPYPRIASTGIVFQSPVSGAQEVFWTPAPGIPATQITSGSGGGHRFPDIRGPRVVFQKVAGGNHEMFVYDIPSGTTAQLTSGSGGGNRYGRLAADGSTVVYEAVAGGAKVLRKVDAAMGMPSQAPVTTSGTGGDRLPCPSGDGEIVFQSVVGSSQEVFRIDGSGASQTQISFGAGGGLRRPSTDAHGHVIVWQGIDGAGNLEVFAQRICATPVLQPFGVAGVPSAGVLATSLAQFRCANVFRLQTSLPPGSAALLAVSPASAFLPLPGAPGNSIYVDLGSPFALILPFNLDPLSGAEIGFAAPAALANSVSLYAQWAVSDPPANAAGVVLTEGFQLSL